MRYAIIVGSHREDSESSKVSKYIESFLRNLEATEEVFIIDLKSNPIPLYDESIDDEGSALDKIWQPYAEILNKSDAFVIMTPEWNGMATPGIKNFFLYVGNEMAHKPALIVTISSGLGGAYPVAELRMSSYKNTHINYIPIQVIVREVEKFFNTLEVNPEDHDDERIKLRMNNSLEILQSYAKALRLVRDDKSFELGKYRYGM